jgi:uncharacterized damage-inducible protein DinB
VPDQRPPRLEAAEGDTLRALLQYQRESLVRKVDGISEAAARATFVGSGTTLLWLVRHMAHAELTWIVYRFGGEDVELSDDATQPAGTLAEAVTAYQAAWREADRIVTAAHSLDDMCRRPEGSPVNLRWVLAHLLEETARHAGHADILRELVDGQTGR